MWPLTQTQRLEAKLKKSERSSEVVYFPGADHGFYGADELKRRDLVLDFLKQAL